MAYVWRPTPSTRHPHAAAPDYDEEEATKKRKKNTTRKKKKRKNKLKKKRKITKKKRMFTKSTVRVEIRGESFFVLISPGYVPFTSSPGCLWQWDRATSRPTKHRAPHSRGGLHVARHREA